MATAAPSCEITDVDHVVTASDTAHDHPMHPDQAPCLLLFNPNGDVQVGLPTETTSGQTLPEIVLRAEQNLHAGRGTSQDLMSLLDPYCEAAHSNVQHYLYRRDYGTLPLLDHQTTLIRSHDVFVHRVLILTNALHLFDALLWSLFLAVLYYRNAHWHPFHYLFITPIMLDIIALIAIAHNNFTLLSVYSKLAVVASVTLALIINPLLIIRIALPLLTHQIDSLLQTTIEQKLQLGYERERFTGLPAFTIALSPTSDRYAVARIY